MNWSKIQKVRESDFFRAVGVKKATYLLMVSFVKDYMQKEYGKGRPPFICIEDQVLICLYYLRNYQTQFTLGLIFEVNNSTICKIINKIETILSLSPDFQLPKVEKIKEEIDSQTILLVDVTETGIERPIDNQEEYYSGKKKAYSQK